MLGTLLEQVRISSGRFGRIELGEPWGLRTAPHGVLLLHHVIAGEVWLEPTGPRAARAGEGDLFVFVHDIPQTVCGPRDAPVDEGTPWPWPSAPVRSAGRYRYGGGGSATVVLCAELELAGAARDRLVRALPPVVHVPAGAAGEAVPGLERVLNLLRGEVRERRPGGAQVAARLAELLLLQAFRVEVGRSAPPGSWRAAFDDERIARSLDAIYTEPERPWTVAGLARIAGMSRTTFSRRFGDLVGDSPIAHLTRWRMDLAKALLRERTPGRTLGEIAVRVGYADEFAFSTAFHRVVGLPPSNYRTGPFEE